MTTIIPMAIILLKQHMLLQIRTMIKTMAVEEVEEDLEIAMADETGLAGMRGRLQQPKLDKGTCTLRACI